MGSTDDGLKAGRDLAERVEKAFRDLEDERESNKTLKLELEKLRIERDALKQQLDARYILLSPHKRCHLYRPLPSFSQDLGKIPRRSRDTPSTSNHRKLSRQLSAQLTALRSRYDDLVAHQQRQEALYKDDYKQWREFKRWLFDEEADRDPERWLKKGVDLHKGDATDEGPTNVSTSRIWKKREKLIEMSRERKSKPSGNVTPTSQGQQRSYPIFSP